MIEPLCPLADEHRGGWHQVQSEAPLSIARVPRPSSAKRVFCRCGAHRDLRVDAHGNGHIGEWRRAS